jgi:comEA protein
MKLRRLRPAWAIVLCIGLVIAPVTALAQQGGTPSNEKVNLNTATLEQLQTLPGVGPAIAKNIVDYRTKVGKFAKIEDILNVKGIGEKKFQRMKDRLTL